MAEHPNAKLIRESYEALNGGDTASAFAAWSDGIIWHERVGKKWAMAGDYVGTQAVAGLFGGLPALGMTAMLAEPHDILASDDHVVALMNMHMERGDQKYLSHEVHIWHFRDGKATEVWLTSQDPDAFDAFWAARL
jgi:ketosteroid isomerase-like protein